MNDLSESVISDLRRCGSCKKDFDLGQFYTKGKDRYESVCKECSKTKKIKLYKMKQAINKRRETIGIKTIELIPVIENYKSNTLRGSL